MNLHSATVPCRQEPITRSSSVRSAIYFTKLNWINPITPIGIGLWVLPRTWILLSDTTHFLFCKVSRAGST